MDIKNHRYFFPTCGGNAYLKKSLSLQIQLDNQVRKIWDWRYSNTPRENEVCYIFSMSCPNPTTGVQSKGYDMSPPRNCRSVTGQANIKRTTILKTYTRFDCRYTDTPDAGIL